MWLCWRGLELLSREVRAAHERLDEGYPPFLARNTLPWRGLPSLVLDHQCQTPNWGMLINWEILDIKRHASQECCQHELVRCSPSKSVTNAMLSWSRLTKIKTEIIEFSWNFVSLVLVNLYPTSTRMLMEHSINVTNDGKSTFTFWFEVKGETTMGCSIPYKRWS